MPTATGKPIYRRVLLKLSGEALMGQREFGIDPSVLNRIANEIHSITHLGVQVALVIGAGNFCRGKQLSEAGLDRITGDNMGMLATLMNALALRETFERIGMRAIVMSALPMTGVVDPYNRRKAMHYLSQGIVIIFAGGTGNPLVTTDSAASLRGIEIEADVIMKATNVDGVYDSDPQKNPHAKLYHRLTYKEVLKNELGVMDLAAFCQCRDHHIELRIFNMNKQGALLRAVVDRAEGTTIVNGD